MGRPVLRTALCDTLDIEYPVVLAGMGPVAGGLTGPVATADHVAAVSSADQVSGLLTRARPAADILHDIVNGAADILARSLPATVSAAPGA
jgi:NAD(P)H-dependent flavin oxidoreductase YrpB (nitropropane dioxygenase family)